MYGQTTDSPALRHPFKRYAEKGDTAPLHPGEILREDFLTYHRLSSAELARRLGTGTATVTALLEERQRITPELAERLSAVFALPSRYWLALQMQYDMWHALEPAGA
jgi:addiction module HigA family antidote